MSFLKRGRKCTLLVALVLTVSMLLAGCGKGGDNSGASSSGGRSDRNLFPATAKLSGISVGGMDEDAAEAAVQMALDSYQMAVTMEGTEFTLSAAELGMRIADGVNFTALLHEANTISGDFDKQIITMNGEEEIQAAVMNAYAATLSDSGEDGAASSTPEQEAAELLRDPTKASIAFDEEQMRFVGVDGQEGTTKSYAQAVFDVMDAAVQLEEQVAVQSETVVSPGEKAEDSEAVAEALKKANGYLDVSLTLNFTPDSGSTKTETITAPSISNWLILQNDGLTVELDTSAMANYCTRLAEKYSVSGKKTSKFKTHSGSVIDVRVATAGQTVDSDALYQDIYKCVSEGISGTRTVAYSKNSEKPKEYVDFGGNYCEVDLTNQMVYVYKNGSLKVSSACVTGCVAEGHATPTGVYSIFSRDKDRYLTGPGYKSWVNFFVPFNGGIGFHDASWRSSFGGTRYLYNGSHGCINMPYSAAKTLYENVSIGTKVVVYGGVSSVDGKSQSWDGKTSYEVKTNSAPFKLDLTAQDNAPLTYSSSDNSVVKVDDKGTVTPVGAGTATITVSAAATSKYKASSNTVTVTVVKHVENQNQSVSVSKTAVSLEVGKSASLGAKAKTTLSFKSSDESVATVKDGTVTAKKAGTATITITAKAENGYNSATATVKVTVVKKPEQKPQQSETKPEKPQQSETKPEQPQQSETKPEVKPEPEKSETKPEQPDPEEGSSKTEPEEQSVSEAE